MTRQFALRDTKAWSDLQAQIAAGRKPSALITDIDDTLYRAGHDGAITAAWKLRSNASKAPYPIIAITGGDYEQFVRGRLESGELPDLDVLVTSVGTEIRYRMSDGSYEKDGVYDLLMSTSGYDRPAVARVVRQIINDNPDIIFQNPGAEAEYANKPDPLYLPYKVSVNFFADTPSDVSAAFARNFPQHRIVVCEAISRSDPSAAPRKKYCLDIVAAHKADAANYLIEKFGLERGVVAGDSGNDIDLLLGTPESFAAVAVGGHRAELKAALEANKSHKPMFIDTDANRLAAQTLLLVDGYIKGERERLI